jgi:hypothetical protein
MVRLAIDFEFPSREWWEAGGQEMWDGLTEGFDGNHVVIDDHLAESWLIQARSIDGWDRGPEYAPHPIRLMPLDEDDEDF